MPYNPHLRQHASFNNAIQPARPYGMDDADAPVPIRNEHAKVMRLRSSKHEDAYAADDWLTCANQQPVASLNQSAIRHHRITRHVRIWARQSCSTADQNPKPEAVSSDARQTAKLINEHLYWWRIRRSHEVLLRSGVVDDNTIRE